MYVRLCGDFPYCKRFVLASTKIEPSKQSLWENQWTSNLCTMKSLLVYLVAEVSMHSLYGFVRLRSQYMPPALDPKQGSFSKRGKYSGSWEEAESPERPTKRQIQIFLTKIGNVWPTPRFSRSPDRGASIRIKKYKFGAIPTHFVHHFCFFVLSFFHLQVHLQTV